MLDIRAALVTIDAAGTQTEIAEKIVDKGGDYLLALKDNQPMLHAAVTIHFDERCEARALDTHATHDKAHGREETRRAWVSNAVIDIESAERWKGLTTVIRIESTRTLRGQKSTETRHYISSKKLTAKQALHAVRSHWGIENGLHWVLDTAFREADSSHPSWQRRGELLRIASARADPAQATHRRQSWHQDQAPQGWVGQPVSASDHRARSMRFRCDCPCVRPSLGKENVI